MDITYDYPLEGAASKAMSVLNQANLDSVTMEVKHAMKTSLRKHLKTWDGAVGWNALLLNLVSDVS